MTKTSIYDTTIIDSDYFGEVSIDVPNFDTIINGVISNNLEWKYNKNFDIWETTYAGFHLTLYTNEVTWPFIRFHDVDTGLRWGDAWVKTPYIIEHITDRRPYCLLSKMKLSYKDGRLSSSTVIEEQNRLLLESKQEWIEKWNKGGKEIE